VLGNARFLGELNIATAALDTDADRLRGEGATAIFIAVEGKVAGVIAIADPVKDSAADALAALKKEGIAIVMLTGDNHVTAQAVARKLASPRSKPRSCPSRKATDVAMESAGVTLLKGDLRGIVHARLLSHATMRNIRQNLFFAFLYNSAGVPIAAGVLYPAFGILLSPIIGALAMSLSSVSVISNALRLRFTKLD
jgi:Cu+-exporting ATPase